MIDLSPTKYVSLSLHDALPIFLQPLPRNPHEKTVPARRVADEPPQLSGQVRSARAAGFSCVREPDAGDRKSTRLNSSHVKISYAVFCLKKKIRSVNCREVSQ